MQRRRGLAALAAVALTVLGVGATATPASAHEAVSHNVRVTLRGDGTSAWLSNDDVHVGAVRMTFVGGTSAGASATVISLRHGGRLSRFLRDLTVAASQNAQPTQAAAAIRDIERIAVGYGGADTLPGRSVTDTVVLPHAGIYYIVNVAGNGKGVSLGRLEASGSAHHVRVPHARATVTLGDESRDVIEVQGTLPRSGTIRVRNDGDMVHLLQITPVAHGVTDAEVQAEYDQLMAGQQPASDPAGLMREPSQLVGSDAVSPELASYLTYHLTAGTYLLQCFVPDIDTGIPHAFMGMHKVVTIH